MRFTMTDFNNDIICSFYYGVVFTLHVTNLVLFPSKLTNASGRYWWDTPVRNILGNDFYLNDDQRTRYSNLRDLFAHRGGVPRHDDMRLAGYTLEEFVRCATNSHSLDMQTFIDIIK